jgi:hypothetical protein
MQPFEQASEAFSSIDLAKSVENAIIFGNDIVCNFAIMTYITLRLLWNLVLITSKGWSTPVM